MEIELRQLQLLQLEIAKEIKRICDKNKIEYFLVGGTLLGAVRHKGFIPWDDDLDIGMKKPEYDRFIECCKNNLSERYELQTWDCDSLYGYPFAKIRMKGTHQREIIIPASSSHDGIWVDVFPYYNVSKELCNKKWLTSMNLISKLYLIKCGYEINNITSNMKSRMINRLLVIYSRTLDSDAIRRKYISRLERVEGRGTLLECDGRFTGAFVFDEKLFSQMVEISFEGCLFSAPARYREYLAKAYGDYMKFPPENERFTGHHVVNCMLEKDYDSYFTKQ